MMILVTYRYIYDHCFPRSSTLGNERSDRRTINRNLLAQLACKDLVEIGPYFWANLT
jgi:hypothetical protein